MATKNTDALEGQKDDRSIFGSTFSLGEIGCITVVIVPLLALVAYIGVELVYGTILTPSSDSDRFVIAFVVASILTLGFVPTFFGAEGMKPWLPWKAWRETHYAIRCAIVGTAILALDWVGFSSFLLGAQTIGPLGEATTYVVTQSVFISLVFILAASAFGTARGILGWLINAADALAEKRRREGDS